MKLLKTKLYAKQRTGAKLALEREAFALFMQQRTGKTITALKVVAVRWRRHAIRLVLVVGPKNVLGGWERQINQHLAVPSRVFVGKDGVRDLKAVKESAETFDGITFLVINYELLWRVWQRLRKLGIHHMILDEGHRIRNRNSRQSKAAWRLGREVGFRLLLTGTPIGKDERDLWAQYRFLEESLFGTKWASFDKRYLRKAGYMGHDRKFRRGMKEKMLKKAGALSYRVEAREMYDLPKEQDMAIYFDLTGKAAKAYEELERDFLFEFDDFKSTTPLAITNMIRLQQLTGGFLGLDDGSLLQLEQDKLLMFADWLEDFPRDQKLVVCAMWTHEIDMICQVMKKMGRSYVVRDGRTKPKDMNAWMDFQDKPHPTTYIMQIASGGVGTDLYAAEVLVFYSNTFNYIDYDQARKRLYLAPRMTFIHMIARNTIDEDRYSALNEKHQTASRTMQALRQRRRTIMAKATAKTEEKTEAKGKSKPVPPAIEKPDYGIDQLAEALGIEDKAQVRVKLRNAEGLADQYKKGRVWDFGNKKNLEAVAKQLKGSPAKAAKKDEAPAKDEKPAKGKKKAE